MLLPNSCFVESMMKKILPALFCLLINLSSNAAVSGTDDRHEVIDAPLHVQDIASSIAALIPKARVKKTESGKYILSGMDYIKDLNFCADARFVANQKLIANCSASLVSHNRIATAGHCIDDDLDFSIDDYYVVFDYQMDKRVGLDFVLDSNQVYEIKRTIQRDFNFPGDIDVALLELKRSPQNRTPIPISKRRVKKGEELYILGFPFGLPMKYQDNGYVTSEKSALGAESSFTHNLDVFSVNSGSAIFSAATDEIVGILVRGSGPNFEKRTNSNCNDWGGIIDQKDHYGEGNYIDLLKL